MNDITKKAEPRTAGTIESVVGHCEDCNGTGWYGDNGPGILGNNEFHECDCGAQDKCAIGHHAYIVVGGVAWCEICNREADMDICRLRHVMPSVGSNASASPPIASTGLVGRED